MCEYPFPRQGKPFKQLDPGRTPGHRQPPGGLIGGQGLPDQFLYDVPDDRIGFEDAEEEQLLLSRASHSRRSRKTAFMGCARSSQARSA